ncbi:MAG: TolC family protein [Elusimicrobiota bacterium]
MRLILLLLLAAAPAHAQPLELTLPQAVARAVEHSEDVKIRGEKKDRLTHTYKKVRAQAYPQVYGSFNWSRYVDKPVQIADFGLGPQKLEMVREYELRTSATATQVLWAFGKVKTAIDIAHQAIGIEGLLHKATVNEIIYAAKQAYLTILLAQETLRIAEESHRNAIESQRALQIRVGQGRASRVDNIKMAADVESRVPSKLEAQSRLDSLSIGFKRLIGAPADAELRLADALTEEFPELSRDQLYGKMLDREPTLRAARRNITLNERILSLRRADYLPTLSAVANYSYYGNGPTRIPERKWMDPSFLWGLQLSVPLWGGGARLNAYREAESDRRVADLEYQKRRLDFAVALDTALSEYRSSIGVYRAEQAARELAEESYQIVLSSFRAGKASQALLNDAELQLTAAKVRTTQSLFGINLIKARIEKLTTAENAS